MRLRTPADFWKLQFELWAIAAEAQIVITARMMGGAGLWPMPQDETIRMFSEKAEAFSRALWAGQSAAVRGAAPEGIALAMSRPIRSKTRSNVRRLTTAG